MNQRNDPCRVQMRVSTLFFPFLFFYYYSQPSIISLITLLIFEISINYNFNYRNVTHQIKSLQQLPWNPESQNSTVKDLKGWFTPTLQSHTYEVANTKIHNITSQLISPSS